MPQEFPKWVYPDGTAQSGVLVHDAAQEGAVLPEVQDAEPDGMADAETVPKRRGRPPKVAA